MSEIIKKLGLKGQNPVLVMNAPEEYEKEIISGIDSEVHREIKGKYSFIQIFAEDFATASLHAGSLVEALEDDGHLWLCYPKGTSKKYKSDLNRTKAWEVFSPYEFEPVTQVSIDDDWSAMRFRHVDNIKTMKRKTAATEKGRARIKGSEAEK